MTKNKRKPQNKKNNKEIRNNPIITSFVLILIGIFFLSTYFAARYDSGIGYLGRLFLFAGKGFFGDVLMVLSLSFIFIGIFRLIKKEKVKSSFYMAFIFIILGLLMLFNIDYVEDLSFDVMYDAYFAQQGGGVTGALIGIIIYLSFGLIGYWLVLVSLLLIGTILLISNIATFKKIKSYSTKLIGDLQDERQAKKDIKNKHREKLRESEKKDKLKEYERQLILNSILDKKNFSEGDIKENKEKRDFSINIKEPDLPIFSPIQEEKNIVSKKDVKEETFIGHIQSQHKGKWLLPSLSLLKSVKKDRDYSKKAELEATALRLEETLKSFGVNIQVKDISCGPAITRYEAVLEPGTKVSKIQGLSEDIALALAATSVRIEAPIPGKSAVGFEIPNKKVAPVYFKEIIQTSIFKESMLPLTIGIGKDITGRTVVAGLADMPHLLIAGSTGSGKSVCLNTIICSLLYKYTPDELKFLMIDPKKVELNLYTNIPHLVAPVVTEPKKSATALKWMVNEMEERYQQLSEFGVKDIKTYNKNVANKDKMPYVVIIIDELADLMMVAPVDVETYICRLAQKARAAGIHLIVATQRPSVQVITGDIKSNIPMRIAFAVFSQVDARTILDSAGAEKLLGKGDMLFTLKGGKLQRIQGSYISEEEIINVTNFLKKQGSPEYLQGAEIIDREEDGEFFIKKDSGDREDELLKEAAKLVLETNQASISMLQRKLRIGYSRAARLIDDLEEKGLIGPFEGTKSREVIANWEDFGHIFGELDE